MTSLQAEFLAIGEGSTGAGVARGAAMRGVSTVLIERRDLADGTTGGFHRFRLFPELPKAGAEVAARDYEACRWQIERGSDVRACDLAPS